jgi:hypothetical protein
MIIGIINKLNKFGPTKTNIIYSDDFDSYTNGYNLADSANWNLIAGQISIYKPTVDGTVHCSNQDVSGVFHTGIYNNNQYAQGIIEAIGGGVIGVAVRCSNGNGYFYFTDSGQAYAGKMVANTLTLWRDDLPHSNVGNIMRIQISGISIVCRLNEEIIYSISDSSISIGNPGIMGANNETTTRIDNWEGGNI